MNEDDDTAHRNNVDRDIALPRTKPSPVLIRYSNIPRYLRERTRVFLSIELSLFFSSRIIGVAYAVGTIEQSSFYASSQHRYTQQRLGRNAYVLTASAADRLVSSRLVSSRRGSDLNDVIISN